MKPPDSLLRWLRAWILGGSSVGLAAAGHLGGGGHAEPVLLAMLVATTSLAASGWVRRERGLIAITGAVVGVQVLAHLALSIGHTHSPADSMLLAHAASALALAAFLRWGESRIFATTRRRYLQWLVTVRCAVAGLRPLPAWSPLAVEADIVTVSAWIHRVGAGRGPPVTASC